ncbi:MULTISPECIES: type II toxin-antitoxin system HicA family toxin [unclassified Nostoc]|uniref:type II toxin-antitoxin system HicA family toxin n=1 Tax=unclassified Nostoc TaxID=2593658 RepID=UPI0013D040FC|nr:MULTISPECIES: type II toxin-antitoxin system HicA family toxin [unclassified Nostoc]MBE9002182.1 type II toxin-antitoxin system HicA family toxin [Nostoc sp. LEGE 12447]NEU79215.1 type II toxin-antitoxin system HicA family toxin [Nostoc sp. UIC 10630]
MKLPRDLSGSELVNALAHLGYEVSHQKGSHIRLTTQQNGEHHITVPAHDPIKIGTLNAILRDVAAHAGFTRDNYLRCFFYSY